MFSPRTQILSNKYLICFILSAVCFFLPLVFSECVEAAAIPVLLEETVQKQTPEMLKKPLEIPATKLVISAEAKKAAAAKKPEGRAKVRREPVAETVSLPLKKEAAIAKAATRKKTAIPRKKYVAKKTLKERKKSPDRAKLEREKRATTIKKVSKENPWLVTKKEVAIEKKEEKKLERVTSTKKMAPPALFNLRRAFIPVSKRPTPRIVKSISITSVRKPLTLEGEEKNEKLALESLRVSEAEKVSVGGTEKTIKSNQNDLFLKARKVLLSASKAHKECERRAGEATHKIEKTEPEKIVVEKRPAEIAARVESPMNKVEQVSGVKLPGKITKKATPKKVKNSIVSSTGGDTEGVTIADKKELALSPVKQKKEPKLLTPLRPSSMIKFSIVSAADHSSQKDSFLSLISYSAKEGLITKEEMNTLEEGVRLAMTADTFQPFIDMLKKFFTREEYRIQNKLEALLSHEDLSPYEMLVEEQNALQSKVETGKKLLEALIKARQPARAIKKSSQKAALSKEEIKALEAKEKELRRKMDVLRDEISSLYAAVDGDNKKIKEKDAELKTVISERIEITNRLAAERARQKKSNTNSTSASSKLLLDELTETQAKKINELITSRPELAPFFDLLLGRHKKLFLKDKITIGYNKEKEFFDYENNPGRMPAYSRDFLVIDLISEKLKKGVQTNLLHLVAQCVDDDPVSQSLRRQQTLKYRFMYESLGISFADPNKPVQAVSSSAPEVDIYSGRIAFLSQLNEHPIITSEATRERLRKAAGCLRLKWVYPTQAESLLELVRLFNWECTHTNSKVQSEIGIELGSSKVEDPDHPAKLAKIKLLTEKQGERLNFLNAQKELLENFIKQLLPTTGPHSAEIRSEKAETSLSPPALSTVRKLDSSKGAMLSGLFGKKPLNDENLDPSKGASTRTDAKKLDPSKGAMLSDLFGKKPLPKGSLQPINDENLDPLKGIKAPERKRRSTNILKEKQLRFPPQPISAPYSARLEI